MSIPSDQTESRSLSSGAIALLEAAERLMGEAGYEGVSVRQINLAAGMANNSAVAYHFRDKNGLVEALFDWRTPMLEARRRQLLDEARAKNRLAEPLALIEILLRPFFDCVDKDGFRTHGKFMNQMLRSGDMREAHSKQMRNSPSGEFALKSLISIYNYVPHHLLMVRLRVGTIAYLDMIWDIEKARPNIPELTDEILLQELFGTVEAICARPVSPAVNAQYQKMIAEGTLKPHA